VGDPDANAPLFTVNVLSSTGGTFTVTQRHANGAGGGEETDVSGAVPLDGCWCERVPPALTSRIRMLSGPMAKRANAALLTACSLTLPVHRIGDAVEMMRFPAALMIVAVFGLPTIGVSQTTDTIRVNVHNHEIVLYRTGVAGPTVILEAGGGSSHRVWDAVVPRLAQHARVVTYDRPGYGLSAACDSPRHALRIARELNEALKAARIDGPTYLAGWSFGGSIVRTFAGEFPASVTGLLLIDPAPEGFYANAARELPDLWTLEDESYVPALFADSSHRAEQREFAGFASSLEQARASDAKHVTPTSLLIAGRDVTGKPDAISLLWIAELKRWATGRPATTVAVVPRVGHHIARENPAAVVAAFLALAKRPH